MVMAYKAWEEILGVPARVWLKKIGEIKQFPVEHGLTRCEPLCLGGYCQRHGRSARIKWETRDGLHLCEECAVIWAARVHFGLPHVTDDL